MKNTKPTASQIAKGIVASKQVIRTRMNDKFHAARARVAAKVKGGGGGRNRDSEGKYA